MSDSIRPGIAYWLFLVEEIVRGAFPWVINFDLADRPPDRWVFDPLAEFCFCDAVVGPVRYCIKF